MTTLSELEAAIANLPAQEFRALSRRLNKRDAAIWDRQIDEDAGNGTLDKIYARLVEDEGGKTKLPFDEVFDG